MLIGEYILSQKSANGTLPENPAFVESIVSTDMGKAIAAAYGVKHIEVLTGFKYIGEQMLKFERPAATTMYSVWRELRMSAWHICKGQGCSCSSLHAV